MDFKDSFIKYPILVEPCRDELKPAPFQTRGIVYCSDCRYSDYNPDNDYKLSCCYWSADDGNEVVDDFDFCSKGEIDIKELKVRYIH